MPTVKDPSKTCVCYCRVSTSKQKASETIEAQVERCERLVERHGLSVLPWGARGDKPTGYVMDKATSGTLVRSAQIVESKKTKPRTPESYAQAIKAAGEKLAGVHAQIDMVLSMYLAKEVDRETWERQRTNLTAAKSAAQGELERVKQEQKNADSKQARADDLYGELRKMLVAWTKPDVSLDVKRGALGKLLDGGRVIVTWAPKSE